MRRLIDAEKLIERCKGTPALEKVLFGLLGIIDEQPTAYDPDKVVEQLENHIRYCELCHEEFENASMRLTYEVQINSYKNAIEIVKAGGV